MNFNKLFESYDARVSAAAEKLKSYASMDHESGRKVDIHSLAHQVTSDTLEGKLGGRAHADMIKDVKRAAASHVASLNRSSGQKASKAKMDAFHSDLAGHIHTAIGNSIPDGDPFDELRHKVYDSSRKHGVDVDEYDATEHLDHAARKNGYKDYHHQVASAWDDYNLDNHPSTNHGEFNDHEDPDDHAKVAAISKMASKEGKSVVRNGKSLFSVDAENPWKVNESVDDAKSTRDLTHEILTHHGFERLSKDDYHHPEAGGDEHPGTGVHDDLKGIGWKAVGHAYEGDFEDGDDNQVSHHYYHHPNVLDHHLYVTHGAHLLFDHEDEDGEEAEADHWSEVGYGKKSDKHPFTQHMREGTKPLRLADKGDPDPDAPPPRTSGKAAIIGGEINTDQAASQRTRAKYIGRTTQDLRDGAGGDAKLVRAVRNKFVHNTADDITDKETALMVKKNKFAPTGSYDLRPDLKPRPITYRQVLK